MKCVMKGALLIASAALLSACALTPTNVKLNYKLERAKHLALRSAQPKHLTVLPVVDERDVDNPRFVIHKKNAYGMTMSGSYLIEQPVAKVMQTALRAGLKQLNYIHTKSTDLQVEAHIVSIHQTAVGGLLKWELGLAVEVKFMLFYKGKEIWRDSFIGRGHASTAWTATSTIKPALSSALTDVIRKLQASRSFYSMMHTN